MRSATHRGRKAEDMRFLLLREVAAQFAVNANGATHDILDEPVSRHSSRHSKVPAHLLLGLRQARLWLQPLFCPKIGERSSE